MEMHIIIAEAGSHLETSPAFKVSPNKLRSAKKSFIKISINCY